MTPFRQVSVSAKWLGSLLSAFFSLALDPERCSTHSYLFVCTNEPVSFVQVSILNLPSSCSTSSPPSTITHRSCLTVCRRHSLLVRSGVEFRFIILTLKIFKHVICSYFRWQVKFAAMSTDMKSQQDEKGAYVRKASSFRNWITADGNSEFPAECGRYHLYVCYACPFACRAIVVRALKGLEKTIGMTAVNPILDRSTGWSFTDKVPRCQLDPINGKSLLKEIYFMADPEYAGRITVPVLWDKQKKTIVNNESSDIIKMLNSEFNAFCGTEKQKAMDLYPSGEKEKIDEVIQWVSDEVNEGVYKAGFATSQDAYDLAVRKLFSALDRLELLLTESRFLTGPHLTLADVRLFTTLVRFDWVYHGHFKCNKKKLIEYPNLWAFTRDIYNLDGIADTVDRDHIINCYYKSQDNVNPNKIAAIGPDLDFCIPVERRKKFGVE